MLVVTSPSDASLSTPPLISRDERRRVWWLCALFALMISLPYFWAASLAKSDEVFGGLLFNPDDQNVHLAWARQAGENRFFFHDAFTTENLSDNSRPLFNNALAWLIGIVSLLTRAPLVWVYHALRIAFAIFALHAFYNLCARLTPDTRARFLSVALAAFGGGAGWLKEIVPGFSNRIWIDRPSETFPMMPEAWLSTSAFIFTLNIASFALLALIYDLVLRAIDGNKRAPWLGFFAALALSNIHTYDALPLIATLLLWVLFGSKFKVQSSKSEAGSDNVAAIQSTLSADSKAQIVSGAAPTQSTLSPARDNSSLQSPVSSLRILWPIILGAALPVIYQFVVFSRSEEFRLKAQTPTLAPPLLDVLLSFGPLILLAAFGAWTLRRDARARLMLIWIIVTFALIYAPVSFARKMIEGVHLPLCFFAAIALSMFLARLPQTLRRVGAMAIVAILSISFWQFVAWCSGPNLRDNNDTRGLMMPPLYLPRAEWQALRWLDNNVRERNLAVLCSPKLGNYVPRETGLTVYIGHWAETLHLGRKLSQAARFYGSQMTREEALQWLRENQIGYVIVGPGERALFGAGDFDNWLGAPIWKEADTAIYQAPS